LEHAVATGEANLDEVSVAEVWALAGLAVLARKNGGDELRLSGGSDRAAMRFAHAVGFDEVVAGQGGLSGEAGQTVGLRRVMAIDVVEGIAREIARMLLPEEEEDETLRSLIYVLGELMRNAEQHSGDPLGCVVAAQRMDAGFRGYERSAVQVVVADAGMGVLEALGATYPDLSDAEAALVKALQPHVSGSFGPGRTGSAFNAGMGLFFISEMAKLTTGRLLVASRGAALLLRGGAGYEQRRLSFLRQRSFPGTLVTFEFPLDEVKDHAALIETISAKAQQRTPERNTSAWVRFEPPPDGTFSYLVRTIAEDVEQAALVSRDQLQKRLFAREAVALDFRHMDVCTQSFLHALLFEAVRMSWAVQVPIYVENAAPSVRTGIALVDAYARGG
jgi:hypothetical protein